jgi:hypothetical protein
MRHHLNAARLLTLMLLVVVALSGCGKETGAQSRLQKAQSTFNDLERLDGPVHDPAGMERLQNLINQGNSLLAGRQVDQAFETSKEAVTLSEELLPRVTEAQARAVFQRAQDDVQVATTNNLRADAERWNRILALQQELNGARSANNDKEIIRLSDEIRSEVDAGVAQVRNRADSARIEANKMLDELRAQGGTMWDQPSVTRTESAIRDADRVYDVDKSFEEAERLFKAAQDLARTGIRNTQEAKSRRAIEDIENSLAVALDEGARDLTADEYNRVSDVLRQMNEDYDNQRFESVLSTSNQWVPRAEKLVEETKRAASQVRIAEIRTSIEDFQTGQVENYLPGRLAAISDLLVVAQQAVQPDTVEAFDQVREIYRQARNEIDRLESDFRELANAAIRRAQTRLDAASAVYNEVNTIFAPRTPENWGKQGEISTNAMDEAREAARIQIGADLSQTADEIERARGAVSSREYSRAIISAQEQETRADAILNRTYQVIANNAVIQLAGLISAYERDGAAIYSPEEHRRANEGLASVRAAIAQENFQQAVVLAGNTRADIDLMGQAVANKAVVSIRETRAIFNSILGSRFASAEAQARLAEADQLILAAEQDLQANRLKGAIEGAERGLRVARQAQAIGEKAIAEEVLGRVTTQMNRAVAAGAERSAGDQLERARTLNARAQEFYAAGAYAEAGQLGAEALDQAEAALYFRINNAESAIAEAQSLGAWDNDARQLSRAVVQVREARELMEEDRFTQAGQLADSANARASRLVNSTKRSNFRDARGTVLSDMQRGRNEGLTQFQAEDAIGVRRQIADLDNNFTPAEYERIMADVTTAKARLRVAIETTDEIVNAVLSYQTNRLDQLVAHGANDLNPHLVRDAREFLKFSRIDYDAGKFAQSRRNLDKGFARINEIEHAIMVDSYGDEITSMFQRVAQAQQDFRFQLSLSPEVVKNLAFGTHARAANISVPGPLVARTYRDEIDRIYSEFIRIVPPPNFGHIHGMVHQVFDDLRVSAIAFDRFVILAAAPIEEGERLIDEAYTRLNRANRGMAEVNSRIFREALDVRLTTAEANTF